MNHQKYFGFEPMTLNSILNIRWRLVAIIVCGVYLNAHAETEFKGLVEFHTVNAEGKKTAMNYYSNGSKVRVEMMGSRMNGAMILDVKTNKMVMLMPAMKKFMPTDPRSDLAPKTMQKELSAMKKTNTTEMILGHTCELWSSTDKDGTTHQIWVTPGMGVFYFLMFGSMHGNAEPPALKKMRKLGLFPLRMADTKDGKEISRMEATKIDTAIPDASLFTIPAGYERFDKPSNR